MEDTEKFALLAEAGFTAREGEGLVGLPDREFIKIRTAKEMYTLQQRYQNPVLRQICEDRAACH